MSGSKQLSPAQETLEQVGSAQLVTLDRNAGAPKSSIRRNGAEIIINVVAIPLGGNYLESTITLSGAAAAALVQKLRPLQDSERDDFMAVWMGAVKDAINAEYQSAVRINRKLTSFTYPIPSFDIVTPKAAATNAFRPPPVSPIPSKTYAAPKSDMILHTDTVSLAPKSKPDEVTGKGTPKDPYVLDLYALSGTGSGPGAMQLVMPVAFSIVGLNDDVNVRYVLSANQLKYLVKHGHDAILITELERRTTLAIEQYGAEHGVTNENNRDFTYSIEGAMKALPGKLESFVSLIKGPPELLAYFAK